MQNNLKSGVLILGLLFPFAVSCAGGGGGSVIGNQGGSEPINQDEAVNYQKAINRCYKTGGSRIVKIEGRLRCF
ncbi:MAG: hypothetical protein KBD78_03215 [Oligoflexales bacterium]|nr:hypothetical protein [Oligoflexales bacterium]